MFGGFLAGAGAGGADAVGGGDEEGFNAGMVIVVMLPDAVANRSGDAVASGEVVADFGVGPLDFVGQRLADVVEQAAGAGHLDIGADFGGQHTGEEANLNGMGQHILAVAVAVFKAAEQADQLRVQAADAHLKGGVLAGAPDGLFNVLLGAVDAFLDAGGLDAPVLDQLGQRQSRDFPAHRVKAGQGYDAGAVVDEDFDPGAGLQGPYVTSFAADETAFHLIVGQGDN